MTFKKQHWVVLIWGLALFAVLAVGVALGWKSIGLWILVVAGGVCLLIAFAVERLIGITFTRGKTKVGFELDAQVRDDLKVTGLAGAAGTYSFIHNQLGNDPESFGVKTKLQDEVVAMVQANAFSEPVGSDKVDQVLSSGSPAERVLVFGLLERDRRLVTVERLRKGIQESMSGNEQYHALLAALTHFGTFSEADQKLLCGYVQTVAPQLNDDPDRKELADKILAS